MSWNQSKSGKISALRTEVGNRLHGNIVNGGRRTKVQWLYL
jgi:hypothetical protein